MLCFYDILLFSALSDPGKDLKGKIDLAEEEFTDPGSMKSEANCQLEFIGNAFCDCSVYFIMLNMNIIVIV